MVRNLLFLFLMVFFSSCEKKPATPQEMILGNWSVMNKDSVKPWLKDIRGFEFLPDGICDDKLGYLDRERYFADTITPHEDKLLYSLGTLTKYSISKDSLKIFNLAEKDWDSFKIKKITIDTLLLAQDTVETTFVKKVYKTTEHDDFDAIVFASSGCFGPCPMNSMIILKNGNIQYQGSSHVPKKGWYTSKITIPEFDKIQRRFKEANYMKLKNNYFITASDGQTVSVSFIKNGRIVKTIEDYSQSAPKEFIWAYHPLISLGQKLKLTQKSINPHLSRDFFFSSLITPDDKMGMSFAESEGFYLVSLLMEAKSTETAFEEKYKWTYGSNDDSPIKQIITDGRHFKIYLKNGTTEIKDLGFNFLKDNNLKEKFEIIKR